ncbi:uncharacterized protein LOC128892490 [Hylaeus anthracinus]|uniref:uncharacterized protein LOC128892490 n=1 Tax=Hylaeus anthracinus TaxID=313031 RepID=UPI0023B95DE4|nr:uncharacterized protein LOC128892490 [Hylaeus anthracinus]
MFDSSLVSGKSVKEKGVDKWLDTDEERRIHALERKSIPSKDAVSAKSVKEKGVDTLAPIGSIKQTETSPRLSDVEARTKAAQSEKKAHSRILSERGVDPAVTTLTETGTTRRLSDIGSEKLVETDTVGATSRYVGDSFGEITEREGMETTGRREHEQTGEREVSAGTSGEGVDFGSVQDECDPTCPRRISRSKFIFF